MPNWKVAFRLSLLDGLTTTVKFDFCLRHFLRTCTGRRDSDDALATHIVATPIKFCPVDSFTVVVWLFVELLYERRSSKLDATFAVAKRKPERIQACTGFEPLISAIPVQRSTNWANTPAGSCSFVERSNVVSAFVNGPVSVCWSNLFLGFSLRVASVTTE